ncbi:hypothetical protein D3C71_2122630 [compost metagenome]
MRQLGAGGFESLQVALQHLLHQAAGCLCNGDLQTFGRLQVQTLQPLQHRQQLDLRQTQRGIGMAHAFPRGLHRA